MRLTAFKSGMSVAFITAASLLWATIFVASTEYDGTSFEAIGFTIAILCAATGSAVMLYSLYETLKLKLPEAQ
jgi:hypothetical protein